MSRKIKESVDDPHRLVPCVKPFTTEDPGYGVLRVVGNRTHSIWSKKGHLKEGTTSIEFSQR